jgi:hypothetical protein
MATTNLHELVGAVVRQCLTEGIDVELDGLGVFRHTDAGLVFVPAAGPRVFIAYVREDYAAAAQLYKALEAAGLQPWLDAEKLLPGQNWRGCVERAIDTSDFFIACFSSKSVRKRGQFPYEVRYALRTADRMPLDDVFILPVRLADCAVPSRIAWHVQSVDLFPDWNAGVATLVEAIRSEWASRQARASELG